MRLNLPNQITIGRLFMTVVFLAFLAQYDAAEPVPWLLDASAALFVLAALSDVLDGYLARKYNQITALGRILDPFVDKILTLGAYVFLAGPGFIDAAGDKTSDVMGWMVVVILGRELLVTSLRGVSEAGGQSFGANVYGKAKMFLQSVTVVWVLLTLAHPDALAVFVALRPAMVYLTVIVTVLSMGSYLWAARGVLTQNSAAAS